MLTKMPCGSEQSPKPRLFMVGPFPPPHHGMSAVNHAMFSAAAASGLHVAVANTAPHTLSRSWSGLVSRWPRLARASIAIARFVREEQASHHTIYCSVSGGLGLFYDTVILGVARLLGAKRLVLHHHSFRYVSRSYWPMRVLVAVCGRDALHIVLGEGMGLQLRSRYTRVARTLVVSNAVFVDRAATDHGSAAALSTGVFRIGYLANLSAAKGLLEMLDLATWAIQRGRPWEFVMAGPFDNAADREMYDERSRSLPNMKYLGPLYGAQKEEFFDSVSAVVFPTRYRHEAEPLVVLEAMRHGRPVIAFGRGCIPFMLTAEAGLVVRPEADFTAAAVALLEQWAQSPAVLGCAGRASRRRFDELLFQGEQSLRRVLMYMHNRLPRPEEEYVAATASDATLGGIEPRRGA